MVSSKQNIRNDKRISGLYRELLRNSKPDMDEVEFRMLKDALNLAMDACEDMPGKLGDHAVIHALGVALIVAREIGLGVSSVISSLLYDFYVEEKFQDKEMEAFLDPQIIRIIEGLAKIQNVDTQKSTDQGENLRNLLLTLSSDVRVILVKLADRLYYMRHLGKLDRAEQLQVASETFYLYAPLAHRLGLYNIKSEMEDLHLKYTDGQAYVLVSDKLQETKTSTNWNQYIL